MSSKFYDINTIKKDSFSFKMENGILKDISINNIEEYGIRYYYNNSCGFLKSNDIKNLKNNINKAKKIAENIKNYNHLSHEINKNDIEYANEKHINNSGPKVKIHPHEIPINDKILLFKEIDKYISENNIKTRSLSYFESRTTHIYNNSDEIKLEYTTTRIGYVINALTKDGSDLQSCTKYCYDISGYEIFEK